MTIQQLIDALQRKIRDGEFLPSMQVMFFDKPIDTVPFKYEDGSVKLTLKYIGEDDSEWEPQMPNDK